MEPNLFSIALLILVFISGYSIGSLVEFKSLRKQIPQHPKNFDDLLNQEEMQQKNRAFELLATSVAKEEIVSSLTNQTISERANAMPKDSITTRLGGIRRPSAQDLEKRKNPKLKETEDAMSETLKEIPEFNKEEEIKNPITSTNDPVLSEEELEKV